MTIKKRHLNKLKTRTGLLIDPLRPFRKSNKVVYLHKTLHQAMTSQEITK